MGKLKNIFYRLTHGGHPLSMLPEERLTRWLCYKDIREWLASQNKTITGKVLCVSGVPPFIDPKTPGMELLSTQYPEVDIQNLPYPDESFDWVITDQVLEHVKDPAKAVSETRRVLKKGGIAIHTTVALYMGHASPVDFWRFFPEGLRLLCSDFSVIHRIHQWGSTRAIKFLADHPQLWLDPRGYVYDSRKVGEMACDSDPEWPIVVWVIAEK